MQLSSQEICRKLLHLFALLMPIGIFYAPALHFPGIVVPGTLAFLFFGSIIVEFLRFRNPFIQNLFLKLFGSMLRKEEDFKITGSTWIIGAGFLCSLFFTHSEYISFIVLTLFVLGDAAAALVGISLGRIKIGKKSLEGSLACFCTCLLLFYAVLPFIPGVLNTWGGKPPIIISFVTAFIITIFELVPLKITSKIVINDNLAVPVIAGFVIVLLNKLSM